MNKVATQGQGAVAASDSRYGEWPWRDPRADAVNAALLKHRLHYVDRSYGPGERGYAYAICDCGWRSRSVALGDHAVQLFTEHQQEMVTKARQSA
jgi:hypothetical protein